MERILGYTRGERPKYEFCSEKELRVLAKRSGERLKYMLSLGKELSRQRLKYKDGLGKESRVLAQTTRIADEI